MLYQRLEPYFYQIHDPELLEAIAQSEQASSYRVLAYSRSGDYTLVKWQYGDPAEHLSTGESLYKGKLLLESTGGAIAMPQSLESSSAVDEEDSLSPSFRKPLPSFSDSIDVWVGKFGMPAFVASDLRNPANHFILH
ncbi:MAG: hypothetical protein WBB28_01820 [Crinalium sp.]